MLKNLPETIGLHLPLILHLVKQMRKITKRKLSKIWEGQVCLKRYVYISAMKQNKNK